MKRPPLVSLLLLTTCALADQLQWNSPKVTEKAIQAIKPNSVLISYCSEAEKVHVEIWRVIKAVSTTTSNEDLLEVKVFAKRLFVSKQTFSRGTYKEPVDFVDAVADPNNTVYSDLYILKGIDLAYVYVPQGKNVFLCLGKKLNIECDVSVEKITLPDEVFKQLTASATREDHRGNKTSIVINHRGEIISETE